jgi:hypothetical protein
MSESEVVPERFIPIASAVTEILGTLPTRADRAELLVVIMRSYDLWLKENVEEKPRTPLGTIATEHETAESMTQMFRDYWMHIMA